MISFKKSIILGLVIVMLLGLTTCGKESGVANTKNQDKKGQVEFSEKQAVALNE